MKIKNYFFIQKVKIEARTQEECPGAAGVRSRAVEVARKPGACHCHLVRACLNSTNLHVLDENCLNIMQNDNKCNHLQRTSQLGGSYRNLF